jgi:hypothetical protein
MRDSEELLFMAQRFAGREQPRGPAYQHAPPQVVGLLSRGGAKAPRKAAAAGSGAKRKPSGAMPPYSMKNKRRSAEQAERESWQGLGALAPWPAGQHAAPLPCSGGGFAGSLAAGLQLPALSPLDQLRHTLERLHAEQLPTQQLGFQPASFSSFAAARQPPPLQQQLQQQQQVESCLAGQVSAIQQLQAALAQAAARTSKPAGPQPQSPADALAALMAAVAGPAAAINLPPRSQPLSQPQSAGADALAALRQALSALGQLPPPSVNATPSWQQQQPQPQQQVGAPPPSGLNWPQQGPAAAGTSSTLQAGAGWMRQHEPAAWQPTAGDATAVTARTASGPPSCHQLPAQQQLQQPQQPQQQEPLAEQQQQWQRQPYQHEGLLKRLLLAAQEPGGAAAGLTPELAAVYLLALQRVPEAQQLQQVRIWLLAGSLAGTRWCVPVCSRRLAVRRVVK